MIRTNEDDEPIVVRASTNLSVKVPRWVSRVIGPMPAVLDMGDPVAVVHDLMRIAALTRASIPQKIEPTLYVVLDRAVVSMKSTQDLKSGLFAAAIRETLIRVKAKHAIFVEERVQAAYRPDQNAMQQHCLVATLSSKDKMTRYVARQLVKGNVVTFDLPPEIEATNGSRENLFSPAYDDEGVDLTSTVNNMATQLASTIQVAKSITNACNPWEMN